MQNKPFEFYLYRLNITDEENILPEIFGKRIRTDEQILALLKSATSSEFDYEQDALHTIYKWSAREFQLFSNLPNIGTFACLILARSTLTKEGDIVTDNGIITGISESQPPLANTIILIFCLKRHLVAVEQNSELLKNNGWRISFSKIIARAANKMQISSTITLEPKPEQHEVIKLFNSFSRLTRIKVDLLIPNPELSKFTKGLHDDLVKGEIREYLQDMKNPNGLSQDPDARPYASAALAEAGYKKGEVYFEGIKEGEFQKIRTADKATKGKIDTLKNFVRGISISAKSKESLLILQEIALEIDRLYPSEEK